MLSRRPTANEPEPRRFTSSAKLFNVLAVIFFGLTVLVCLGFGLIFALDPFTAAATATDEPSATAPVNTPTATLEPTVTPLPTLPPLPAEITATPLGAPPAAGAALDTPAPNVAETATPTLAVSIDTATSTVTPGPSQTLPSGYP